MTGIHTLISGYGGTGGTEIQYDLRTTPCHPLTECKQVIHLWRNNGTKNNGAAVPAVPKFNMISGQHHAIH